MQSQFAVEGLIENWNESFAQYKLTVEDLKKPLVLMGGLFVLFERFDIDRAAVLAPPPEEEKTENLYAYWDLIPIMNTRRVINHLMVEMPHFSVTITHLLQPTLSSSHSILMLLLNLMMFREERITDIATLEEELFSMTDKAQELKNQKNHLMELLNNQFAEKAERAGRLKNIDHEIKQYEEERRQEKEAIDEITQVLEPIQKEVRQLDALIEQKKLQRDAIVAEVNKNRALRVTDAEDILAQVEQAEQNNKDAKEMLAALQATLMQKENCVKNLQAVKPSLDVANDLLYEITKSLDSLRDYENGDPDSADSEQKELSAELCELEAQLADVAAERAEACAKRQEAGSRRQHERAKALSDLREAEEKDKKCAEQSRKAVQRVAELQNLTKQYEAEKTAGLEELNNIKENLTKELSSLHEALLRKAKETQEKVIAKISNRCS